MAASGDTQVVALEDVSAEMLERERKIELQKEDLASKPEAIRCAPHRRTNWSESRSSSRSS